MPGVFVGLLVAASGVEARIHRCGPDGSIAQDTPCPVVNAPLPPPPKPPCALSEEEHRRATRREEQFLIRFPDQAAHERARRSDLEPVVAAIRKAKQRLGELMAEREPILKELEFYKHTPPPPALKARADANDAQLLGLVDIFRGRAEAIGVVVARFDCERATYAKLWAGAAPGSSACDRPTCVAA